jgi:pyridoxal phosphate enzyme (YggS family)
VLPLSNLNAEALRKNYTRVCHRLQSAVQKTTHDTSLLAVSKKKSAEEIQYIYHLGQRHFGENYLQDAQLKIKALNENEGIHWHWIGHIQSNKTKLIAELFDTVETVDRKKIALQLHKHRPHALPPLEVLIQINISLEPQKSGIHPEEIHDLINYINNLERLSFKGLMCIPSAPNTTDFNELTAQLHSMQSLFINTQHHYPSCQTLSVGMSSDLELAVQYGSTQVRIGTDIFGARST